MAILIFKFLERCREDRLLHNYENNLNIKHKDADLDVRIILE